jgi:DNA-binding MarR family transcriptional regulator
MTPECAWRDIAASLDITEYSAFGTITDLAEAGYVVKEKDGRRNRYHIRAYLLLTELARRDRTVGEILACWSTACGIHPLAGSPA